MAFPGKERRKHPRPKRKVGEERRKHPRPKRKVGEVSRHAQQRVRERVREIMSRRDDASRRGKSQG